MSEKIYFVRRRYLVQKSLQFKYMALVLFAIIVVTGMIVWTVYFTHWMIITEKFMGTEARGMLNEVFHKINVILLYEIPLALFVAAFASLIISHKVAGPVYRLEKIARKVAQGDLTYNVRLRKNDELKNVASAFNAVIENMQHLVIKDKKLISELSEITNRLYNDLKDKKISQDEALILIRRLNELVSELKNLILQYKIEKG